jgi:hypothetical protein
MPIYTQTMLLDRWRHGLPSIQSSCAGASRKSERNIWVRGASSAAGFKMPIRTACGLLRMGLGRPWCRAVHPGDGLASPRMSPSSRCRNQDRRYAKATPALARSRSAADPTDQPSALVRQSCSPFAYQRLRRILRQMRFNSRRAAAATDALDGPIPELMGTIESSDRHRYKHRCVHPREGRIHQSEPGCAKQAIELVARSFDTTRNDHHVQIHKLALRALVRRCDNVLHDDQSRGRTHGTVT